MSTLRSTPCPRCGCYLAAHFKCNCGEVHSDYCVNCNRWVDLPPGKHVELDEIDAPCDVGPVPHEHPMEEKSARLAAYFARNP